MPYVDGKAECGWCGETVTLKVLVNPPEVHTEFMQDCPACGAGVQTPKEEGGVARCASKGADDKKRAEPVMVMGRPVP